MSKLGKTIFALFCGRGLMALRQLVAVPILLKCWGVEYYGQWLVVSSIPTFLAMSNLGLGSSAAVLVAMKTAADDKDGASAILATAWAMLAVMIALLMCCLSAYLWIFGMSKGSLPDGGTVLTVMLVSVMVKMLAQPLTGWWNGKALVSQNVHLWNISVLGDTLIALFVPILGGDAPTMVCIALAWTLVWMIHYVRQTRKRGCDLWRQASFKSDFKIGRNLLTTGIGHQLSPLWQGVYFQGSILLASQMFGPVGAAAWGSVRIFTRAGNQILELLSQSLAPDFQQSFGTGRLDLCRKWHSLGIMASIAFASAVCVGLLFPGKLVFDIWTHAKFEISTSMWVVTCACLIPFSFWQLSAEVQRSANKPWSLNVWGVIAACVSLGVMKLGAGYGLISLAWGALLFEIMMAFFVLPVSCRLIDQPVADLISEAPKQFKAVISYASNLTKKRLGRSRVTQ